MRLRPDITLGVGVLLLLILVVMVAESPDRQGNRETDRRRSTFLTGPHGARGLSDALERIGVRVDRHRHRLAALTVPAGEGPSAVAVLDPSRPLDGWDALALQALGAEGVDLVVAGPTANAVMRCFGYRVQTRSDSISARMVGHSPPRDVWIGAVLARTGEAVVIDSTGVADVGSAQCEVPDAQALDTLLLTDGGRLAALRLWFADRQTVTLVADGAVFGNRRMRDTEAGVFTLGLFAGRYAGVIFDEYHHGFGRGGSLAGSVLSWSVRSPWGWAAWQVAVVGLLALFAAGVRFGPVTSIIHRERRSPLEHVQALATALAATHGQAVAIRLIVRGLERRLSGVGQRAHPDPATWLASLAPTLRTSNGRSAVERLQLLIGGPQRPDAVLEAAHAVEDVWEDLKP
ncbi:MAG: hypothetical protein HKM89_05265 [Gemmatimonadales bacterium]|nr:hypothetical protein [Gemmatimonadales bacterium]